MFDGKKEEKKSLEIVARVLNWPNCKNVCLLQGFSLVLTIFVVFFPSFITRFSLFFLCLRSLILIWAASTSCNSMNTQFLERVFFLHSFSILRARWFFIRELGTPLGHIIYYWMRAKPYRKPKNPERNGYTSYKKIEWKKGIEKQVLRICFRFQLKNANVRSFLLILST